MYILVIILVCLSWCQVYPKATDNPIDLSTLAQIERLLAPGLAQARYVRLAVSGVWLPTLVPGVYESSGNCWMLQEMADQQGRPLAGRFLVDGAWALDVIWTGRGQADSGRPIVFEGSWRPADPKMDVGTVIRYLSETERPSSDVIGRLGIFAVQLYQFGFTFEADRVLGRLAQLGISAQAICNASKEVLAAAEYRNAYTRFLAGHDWQVYSSAIRDIQIRYPGTWATGQGVQRLLSAIEARLAGNDRPVMDTNGLSPQAIALTSKMADMDRIRTSSTFDKESVIWLVPGTWPAIPCATHLGLNGIRKGSFVGMARHIQVTSCL